MGNKQNTDNFENIDKILSKDFRQTFSGQSRGSVMEKFPGSRNLTAVILNFIISKKIIRAAMIVLGCIFICASVPKILNPEKFAEIVFNYQILPDMWINIFAIVLPWLELVTGICLVFDFFAPGAVIVVNLLLMVFICVLFYDLARGIDVRCGCFSTDIHAGSANFFYIVRDMGFWIIGIFLFFNIVTKHH